jgi:hypothetical protein
MSNDKITIAISDGPIYARETLTRTQYMQVLENAEVALFRLQSLDRAMRITKRNRPAVAQAQAAKRGDSK